jgi:hypothetical protein
MSKSLVTVTVSLAILSLGTLISDHAQAGSSNSAAPKYNNKLASTIEHSVQNQQNQPRAQATKSQITSFSSSSAKSYFDGTRVRGTSR